MIRLIAPKDKVLPWLEAQDAHWRKVGTLPIATDAEWKHASDVMHRSYKVLFEGLRRGFERTEQEELNPNLVIMASAYVGDLEEHRPRARQVYIEGMLSIIAEAKEACTRR